MNFQIINCLKSPPLFVNTNWKECPELPQVSKLFKGVSVRTIHNSYIVSSVPFYSEIRLYLKGDWRDFRQEEVTLAGGNFNLNVHGNQSSYERW